ncbi:MAG: hypothetical protein ACLT2T_11305 [Bilophila wadsworthia]
MRLRVILSCTMSTALAMVPKTLGGGVRGFVFAEQRGAVLPDGRGDTFHEISLALFIFFRLFLGGVPPDELAVQVDGEDDVRPQRTANGNRHGIDQPPSNSQRS